MQCSLVLDQKLPLEVTGVDDESLKILRRIRLHEEYKNLSETHELSYNSNETKFWHIGKELAETSSYLKKKESATFQLLTRLTKNTDIKETTSHIEYEGATALPNKEICMDVAYRYPRVSADISACCVQAVCQHQQKTIPTTAQEMALRVENTCQNTENISTLKCNLGAEVETTSASFTNNKLCVESLKDLGDLSRVQVQVESTPLLKDYVKHHEETVSGVEQEGITLQHNDSYVEATRDCEGAISFMKEDNAIPLDTFLEQTISHEEIEYAEVENPVLTRDESIKSLTSALQMLGEIELSNRRTTERMVKLVEDWQDLKDDISDFEDFLRSIHINITGDDLETLNNVELTPERAKSMNPTLQFSILESQEKQKYTDDIPVTSTPITTTKPKERFKNIADKFEADENGMVVIGPNDTKVAKTALQAINWSLSGAAITRKILVEVFGRKTLASHTLTGKPSPAFLNCDKPIKNQLCPLKVADIINLVTQHTQLTVKEVKNAITTKCADENKMLRQKKNKSIIDAVNLKRSKQT